MAKSQKHGNREAKKPKKVKEAVIASGSAKAAAVLIGQPKKK